MNDNPYNFNDEPINYCSYLITQIPKDGNRYVWKMNYEQFHRICSILDRNGRPAYLYKYGTQYDFFGMAIDISNEDKPVRFEVEENRRSKKGGGLTVNPPIVGETQATINTRDLAEWVRRSLK